ncbi:hypothetical protein [Streptomyces sp. NPDC096311]|uniref:hypothetical protein n=1 Tax=Streptomyces sp. NPDC096311 TaxID=3366083 RepID=UPI0037F3B392
MLPENVAFEKVTVPPENVDARHAAAPRNLFNRMLGQMFHCLQRRELFDENTAFPTALAAAA